MAYDEALADRVRQALGAYDTLTERQMFGGVCFMLGGHMAVGVLGSELILRLGDAGGAEALKQPHTRPFDFTGKPMHSTIYLEAAGAKSAKALQTWVAQAAQFAQSLPPKKKKK